MRTSSVLISLAFVALASARTFTVVNSCSYTVWPAIFTDLTLGSSTPDQPTGWEQEPKEVVTFSVPNDWTGGRIWGRRDCNFSVTDGPSSCLTGGCNGGLECDPHTGTPVAPVTVAEFALGASGSIDVFDVSLVDGFNIPIRVQTNKGCAVVSCPVDLNPNCDVGPAALAGPFDSSGKVAGCKSACAAGLGDPANSPNCCTGTHSTPSTCPASGVQFYSYFKGNCPTAMAFVYDQSTAPLSCPSTLQSDYTITFCP
ncbi:Osmotin thaumatin-like protein [Pilatotrama ljubarskyi]|nr:Osmotin thaumatin-like protein [Pilatotrama ljubarskyi]